jgi:hypothetical protein
MYKQHLLQAIDREILLTKQLIPFMDETKLDFRFGEKTRSTLEVMQYLSTIGDAMMQYYAGGMTREHWREVDKRGKAVTLQNFAERMDEQQKLIHSYFEKISDDDLMNKEVELFWKEKMPLGVAIMQGPVKFLTSYRMELFKLVKLSGRPEMSTGEAWVPGGETNS